MRARLRTCLDLLVHVSLEKAMKNIRKQGFLIAAMPVQSLGKKRKTLKRAMLSLRKGRKQGSPKSMEKNQGVCLRACPRARACVCVWVRVCVRAFVRACLGMYVYIYIYIYICACMRV